MIRPLNDRVIVKRKDAATTTASGIIIPDSAKEKPQEGEVVAVGNGKKNDNGDTIKMDVKVGDRVLFGKYAGSEIRIDDEDYLMMQESDIYGIID